MDLPTFRTTFPEFADVVKFPDARVNLYLTLGTNLFVPEVWGAVLDTAIALFTAHSLALNAPRVVGGVAVYGSGVPQGLATSKSVGGVSKSVDVSVGQMPGAGTYNLTTYGQQLVTLADSLAVGVKQF